MQSPCTKVRENGIFHLTCAAQISRFDVPPTPERNARQSAMVIYKYWCEGCTRKLDSCHRFSLGTRTVFALCRIQWSPRTADLLRGSEKPYEPRARPCRNFFATPRDDSLQSPEAILFRENSQRGMEVAFLLGREGLVRTQRVKLCCLTGLPPVRSESTLCCSRRLVRLRQCASCHRSGFCGWNLRIVATVSALSAPSNIFRGVIRPNMTLRDENRTSSRCRSDLNHSAIKLPSGANVSIGSKASSLTSCQKLRKRRIAVELSDFEFPPAHPSAAPASLTRLPYILTLI